MVALAEISRGIAAAAQLAMRARTDANAGFPTPTPLAPSSSANLSWQHFLPLAASWATVTTAGELIAKSLECAVALLNADETGLALYDPAKGSYRVTGVAGAETGGSSWLHPGNELPADLPVILRAIAYDIVVTSSDDDLTTTTGAIPPNGVAMYVIVRHGSEVLGLLYALRAGGPPFGAGAALLGRGIADEIARGLAAREPIVGAPRGPHTEILANIAHELRSPLTTILGCGELLETGVEAADVAYCAERIQDAGWMLRDVVDDVIAFGRVAAGRNELVMTQLSLSTFWNAMARRCARLRGGGMVELQWSRKIPSVDLMTDTNQLTRVLWQVVSNAVKFTERGVVRVGARARGADLEVEVTDSGPGIRLEDRECIFEPFWQADASMTRAHGGLGLGLYLARNTLQQLGGSIVVGTAPEGQGAVFTVALPNALRRSQRRPTASRPQPARAARS